jgi:hypothetical protein
MVYLAPIGAKDKRVWLDPVDDANFVGVDLDLMD